MAFSASAHDERASAQVSLFGEATERACPRRGCRARTTGRRSSGWPGAAGDRLLPLRPPARRLRGALRREKVVSHADLLRQASARRRRSRGSPARSRRSISASRRAATASPSSGCPIRPGSTRCGSSPTCSRPARDHLEAGAQRRPDRRGDGGGRRDAAARPARRSRSTSPWPAPRAAGLRIYRGRRGRGGRRSLAARLEHDPARARRTRQRGPIEIVVMAPDLPGEHRDRPAGHLSARPAGDRRAEERAGVAFLEEF